MTCGVEVPDAGVSGAEAKEKGKGVAVMAGSGGSPIRKRGATNRNRIRGVVRQGTSGYATAKSSIREWGVLYRSGGYALKDMRLTPGGLPGVRIMRTGVGAIRSDRRAGVAHVVEDEEIGFEIAGEGRGLISDGLGLRGTPASPRMPPWRLSRSPALALALPTGFFAERGFPLTASI